MEEEAGLGSACGMRQAHEEEQQAGGRLRTCQHQPTAAARPIEAWAVLVPREAREVVRVLSLAAGEVVLLPWTEGEREEHCAWLLS